MELMHLRTEEQHKTKPTKTITARAVITTHIQGRKAIQPRTIPPNLITMGAGKPFIPVLVEESTITTAKAKRLMFPKDE